MSFSIPTESLCGRDPGLHARSTQARARPHLLCSFPDSQHCHKPAAGHDLATMTMLSWPPLPLISSCVPRHWEIPALCSYEAVVLRNCTPWAIKDVGDIWWQRREIKSHGIFLLFTHFTIVQSAIVIEPTLNRVSRCSKRQRPESSRFSLHCNLCAIYGDAREPTVDLQI